MNMLILDVAAQTQLAALNADGEPIVQLGAIPLTNGDGALTASLLTDCGEGQTWEHYGSFLQTLPQGNVSEEQIVQIEIG